MRLTYDAQSSPPPNLPKPLYKMYFESRDNFGKDFKKTDTETGQAQPKLRLGFGTELFLSVDE